MVKTFKILLLAIVGISFSIATLEIDAFGYDNTFFDSYDSYIQANNDVLHHLHKADHDSFALPEVLPSSRFVAVALPSIHESSSVSLRLSKRKLYLFQSSLLI